MRLAAHRAGRHGLVARHGLLADAVVEALLASGDHDTAVRLHGERVSAAMRRRIVEHPDPAIRDAYTNFVRNMVECGVTLGIDDLEEAYGRPRSALAGAPSPMLRAAVAGTWHDRPLDIQVGLLADPDERVRAAATERSQPGVPPAWRDRCLADPAMRVNVAHYIPLTSEQFVHLMRSGDEAVHQAVAGNPHLSAEMVARLLESDNPLVRVTVANSRHVDAETRDRLHARVPAERAAGNIEAEMLDWNTAKPDWLRDAPLSERMTYLDCPHAAFRHVLASCRDLPEEAWRRLDDDPDLAVRRAAARRPDAPAEVLEQLVRAHGDVSHIRPRLVDHPNFPRHRLRTFAEEPSPHVRYVALQDRELPVKLLEQLALEAEPFLRRGVARHPNTPETLRERLLSDEDPEVVDDAAANSLLPVSTMYRILTAAGL